MVQKQIPEFTTQFEAEDPRLFHYQLKIDGELLTLALKPLVQLPMGVIEDMWEATRGGDEQAQMHLPLKWACLTEDDTAIIRRLPPEGMAMVFEAWQEHSEIELGELSRLPASSPNGSTGTPSRPTLSAQASV